MPIPIHELLDSRSITILSKAKSKADLLRDMTSLLARANRLKNPKKALADLVERENEKGTGLEHGVAVPHCRSEGTEKLAAAFALVRDGIDFGAMDGEPSRFVFLLISPRNATTTHVQALATMARILKKQEVQEALVQSETTDDIEKILTETKV